MGLLYFQPNLAQVQALFFQKANLMSSVHILKTSYCFHQGGELKKPPPPLCRFNSDPPVLTQLVGTNHLTSGAWLGSRIH